MSPLAQRSVRLVAGSLLPLLIVLGSACDDSDLPTTEGVYIDYRWEPQLTPCGGEAALMDDAVVWYGNQLGLDPSRYPNSSYSWISDETFEERHGTRSITGVAYRGRADGRTPSIIHEIAHLVDGRWRGRGSRLFVEGLAVALAPKRSGGLRSPRLDPRPYIDGPLPEDLSFYPAAGSFVTYLLGRFGPDLFHDFTANLSWNVKGSRIREAFAETYGEDLDDFVEDLLGASECPEDALPLPQPLSCGAPLVPWVDDERWFYARPIVCEADDVHGGHGNNVDQARVYRTLEIPEDGTYTLTLYGDRELELFLESCGPCPWLEPRHLLTRGERVEVQLGAGLHTIVLSTKATSIALAGITLTRVQD